MAAIINRSTSDGANGCFGGFVFTTIVGFFALAIVLLRRGENTGAATCLRSVLNVRETNTTLVCFAISHHLRYTLL
jgi:hypothetical protein